MTLINRATLKYPDAREKTLALMQVEKTVYRWLVEPSGKPWDGVDHMNRETAIQHLRVSIDSDPAMVGVDLTIHSIKPTADVRAAERCVEFACEPGMWHPDQDHQWAVDRMATIVRQETNIDGLTEHMLNLLAYLFRNRAKFAKALFPVVEAGAPRDLVMDGLLLNVVEAMEKTTAEKYENLTKILKEPPSQIIQMGTALPPKGRAN